MVPIQQDIVDLNLPCCQTAVFTLKRGPAGILFGTFCSNDAPNGIGIRTILRYSQVKFSIGTTQSSLPPIPIIMLTYKSRYFAVAAHPPFACICT
jgi:hypothetical protein